MVRDFKSMGLKTHSLAVHDYGRSKTLPHEVLRENHRFHRRSREVPKQDHVCMRMHQKLYECSHKAVFTQTQHDTPLVLFQSTKHCGTSQDLDAKIRGAPGCRHSPLVSAFSSPWLFDTRSSSGWPTAEGPSYTPTENKPSNVRVCICAHVKAPI